MSSIPMMDLKSIEATLTTSSKFGVISLLIELMEPDSPTSEAIGPPKLLVTIMSVPLMTISASMSNIPM